jgi:hypothetical protein
VSSLEKKGSMYYGSTGMAYIHTGEYRMEIQHKMGVTVVKTEYIGNIS